MQAHEKIIKASAKKILQPAGLFQKGTSRIWLEDNGYYLTQVEFQPSAYSKGSFVNVGVSFLWEFDEILNSVLGFNYGYRLSECGFTEYDGNDEKFQETMESYANAALQKVIEYRQFRNLDYAKQIYKQEEKKLSWQDYNLAMICFLKGDYEEGMESLENLMKRVEEPEEYAHLLPRCSSKENAKKWF